MKRRHFVKASLLTPVAAQLTHSLPSKHSSSQPSADSEFYELRIYTLKNAMQLNLVQDFLKQAAIPALNKFGSKTIGVFTEYLAEGFTKLVVVIPFSSIDAYIRANDQLAKMPPTNKPEQHIWPLTRQHQLMNALKVPCYNHLRRCPGWKYQKRNHGFLNCAAMKARMKLPEKRK